MKSINKAILGMVSESLGCNESERTEGNLVALEGQEAVVGDGNAMGVAGEIAEHMMGAAEGWLGVDDPVLTEQGAQEGAERLLVGEWLKSSGESELALRLVIDEVGYLTYGPEATNVLFHVVNDRHLKKRPMIFTTNKPLSEWGKVLHDEDMAAAILDRVLERGRFIHLDGPSGRTRHLNLQEVLPGGSDRARISGIDAPEFPEMFWCYDPLLLIRPEEGTN